MKARKVLKAWAVWVWSSNSSGDLCLVELQRTRII